MKFEIKTILSFVSAFILVKNRSSTAILPLSSGSNPARLSFGLNPSGKHDSAPGMSTSKLTRLGWLHILRRIVIAFNGCDSLPLRSAFISGELMKNLYRSSWNGDNEQNTTCSYLTGTVKRGLDLFRAQVEST